MTQYLRLIRIMFLITVASTVAVANASWRQRPNTWSHETQITNSQGDSRLVDLYADPSGHAVYLTWEDSREGTEEVYFMRSLDDGMSWGPELKLSQLTPETTEPEPRLVANGQLVLVFFANRTATGEHMFYSVSNDWGNDFSTPLQLTYDSGDQSNVAAASGASVVHVVWQGSEHIFYAKSTNSGRTWQTEIALTNASAAQDQYPAIAAVGDEVFVTWSRMHEGAEAIYVKVSLDSGYTWQPEIRVSGYTGDAFPQFPAITSNGTCAHLVWGSNNGLQYSRSSDSGETWSNPISLTNADRQYIAPRIAVATSQVQVVTSGIVGLSSDILYLDSYDGGETWNAPLALTAHESTTLSLAPVISSNREGTFVAWEDNRNGHFAIFFLSRPDFLLLHEFELQLFIPVVIVLAAATSLYLGIELRASKQGSRRRNRSKTSHRRTETLRRNRQEKRARKREKSN